MFRLLLLSISSLAVFLASTSVLAGEEGLSPPLPAPPASPMVRAPATPPPSVNTASLWQDAVKLKLQKKVTLALDEAALSDALANLRQMGTVAIFSDPSITDEDAGDINLTFSETPLSEALPKLLGPLGLQYTIRDEAVFVYRRNAYADELAGGGTLPDAKVNELNGAIAELSSDQFEVREHGFAALSKLGAAAAPYLTKAIRASSDPEAQLRMRRLTERFAAKPFPTPAPDVAKKLDAIDTMIATDFESTRVGEAVAFIAMSVSKKSGKRLEVSVDGDIREQPVYMAPAVLHAGNLLKWLAVLSNTKIVIEGDRLTFTKGQ